MAALALTVISTPLIRRLAVWAGFVDLPAARKMHSSPVPLLGGLAIAIGVLLAYLLFTIALPISILAPPVVGTVLASLVMVTVGLIDDRRRLPAWVKLAGQLLAFAVLVYFGVQVSLQIPEWLNLLITMIWVIGISNALNFLDNMNGLSAGISGVAASFILLLAVFNEQFLVAALAAGILGACLGFLRYNFGTARIFMGDAGSLFLGFLLAVLGIQLRFPENSSFVTWMVPVLILGVPILDMSLVLISRTRRRVNPLTTAGQDHLSHRLVDLGFARREAVLVLYLVGGMFGMAALFVTNADILEGYAFGFAVALICLYVIWRLEKIRDRKSADSGE